MREKERGRDEGRRGGREGRGREGRGGERIKHLAKIWSLKESACLSLTLPFDECLRKGFAAEPLGHSAFFLPSGLLFDGKAIILLPPKKSPYNTTGLPIITKAFVITPLPAKNPGPWGFVMETGPSARAGWPLGILSQLDVCVLHDITAPPHAGCGGLGVWRC